MDFVGDGFQVDMICESLNVQLPTGRRCGFPLFDLERSQTSRMVFTSSVIVPLAVAVNQLDPRFWRQISVVPFLSGKCVGEHILGSILVDKLVEQLSAAKSFYSGFFNSSITGCWVVKTTGLVFFAREWDIDFPRIGAAPCS